MAELTSENFPQEEDEDDRRSFDRWSEGSRDEFWDALSSNYDYLMDDGLIATCREASSDLSVDEEADLPKEDLWTFGRFTEQFRGLHDLLHNLQRDSRKKEGSDEERQKITHMCRLFNEHAQHLCRRHPDMREEVYRRLNLLNNKWKAVLGSLRPSKDALFDEIAGRMRNLRRWLREVEGRLSPVPSASPNTLKEKHQKQIVLQKEIEEKGKCVASLLKVCGRLEGNVRFGASLTQWDAERVRRVASNLEHRWHALWLSSLERLCALEESLRNTGHEKLEKSFSEEPLTKYPRLSDSFEAIALLEDELKMIAKSNEVLLDIALTRNKDEASISKNDKAVMVGDTGITALKADCGSGKFEIVQDVGYSSETSAHFSTDDRPDVKDKAVCLPVLHLSPDKYPSVSLKTLNILSEERSFRKQGGCKSVPDTFYKMACVDDLPEEDATDRPCASDNPKTVAQKKSRQKFHAGERERVRPNDLLKRSVCEWLDKCHLADGGASNSNGESKLKSDWLLKVGNNSCDASGECTTNESDSEKSTSDVNNSVTFSQSFTGSIETVIPSTVEPSPCVRLRSKKRRPTRGRPWSVIELNRATVAPSVPHSTSEGALDTLHRSSSMPKRKKRLSLTDISGQCAVSSPSAMDDSKALLSETNSLLTTEDQASLSDQAWDEYQDPPYLSEPYSEQTIDEDEVRKLISFGDDYRATLGSYSDGSSVSLRPPRHRNRTKASKSNGGDSFHGHLSSDTNSDCEDFHHILKTSGHTLQFVSHTMKEGAPSSKYAELIATTKTNLCLLKEIAAARCELESVSKEGVQKLQDLIGEWEELQTMLLVLSKSSRKEEEEEPGEETSDIHTSLESLREQLGVMEEQANLAIGTATSLEQLNANIQELQCALSQLQDMKARVLHISARVLRLGNGSSLREGATQLYQRWEDVYELNCTQLTKLQKLQSGWGKSKEEQLEEPLETTMQWQPVQVEITLPTAEVCVENHQLRSVGAEVQTSEHHNALLDMEEERTSTLVVKETLHNTSNGTAEKKKKGSCVWRVLWASFPFQLLLLLLFCLSCHTEPRCCENINNYDFSVHLRYLEGPPPV